MGRKNKNILIICIMAVIAVILVLLLKTPKNEAVENKPEEINEETNTVDEEYKSPIDFDELKKQNPDIYAWIKIPGTEISYPILQNEDDDSFYLNHDVDGKKDSAGSLYTEHEYNSKDFSDIVTMIYGHDMLDGRMFGKLQEYYSDSDFFKSNNEIDIYMPDNELHYTIFAAVPFEKWHILYNYDFSNSRTYRVFFDDIMSVRAIGANVDENASLEPEDKVIILSTCLKGKKDKRYLVCAKLVGNE